MSEMIDYGLKAKDRSTLDGALVGAGLLSESVDIDGRTMLMPAVGVAYHYIGPLETSPAVLDDDGNVVTPATVTTDVYGNVRLNGEAGAGLEAALLAAFPDTTTPMTQDAATASYAMDLRVPITAVWG